MLKALLPGIRVVPDPVERQRLIKVVAELDHAVEDSPAIISINTYRRWL